MVGEVVRGGAWWGRWYVVGHGGGDGTWWGMVGEVVHGGGVGRGGWYNIYIANNCFLFHLSRPWLHSIS